MARAMNQGEQQSRSFSIDKLMVVCRKELRDALRDRKALMTIFFSPLFTLALMFGLSHFFVFLQSETESFRLHVQGGENAQPLIDWFQEQNIQVIAAPDMGVEAVASNDIDMLLLIPPEFPERFETFDHPELQLVYDRSRKDVLGKATRVKMLIQQWGMTIGTLRLIARGVAPQVVNPLSVRDVNVSERKSGAAVIYGILAMVLTFSIFTSSTGVSVDMMAGEREKHSLEPLLLNPVAREVILGGKWLAAVLCTLVVIVFINIAMYLMIPLLPLEQLGVRAQLTLMDVLALTVLSLPLILISTMFQLFISIFSKTFKEAQSYIALLMLVPILLGYYVIWADVSQPWHYWVPIMGTQTLMEDLLSLGSARWIDAFASVGVALALSLVLAAITVKQLKREKIIYG